MLRGNCSSAGRSRIDDLLVEHLVCAGEGAGLLHSGALDEL